MRTDRSGLPTAPRRHGKPETQHSISRTITYFTQNLDHGVLQNNSTDVLRRPRGRANLLAGP